MSFSVKLASQDIRNIDRSDMLGHISRMGEHLRESVEFTNQALAGAALPKGIRQIVVLGIGGSAIGGDLVKSYLTGKLRVPMHVSRGYELPAFADENTLVIISSYSGNTEESLSQFEQAIEKKLPILCMTTGGTVGARAKELGLTVIPQRPGMQPRAALAYSFAPILLLLQKMGFTSGEEEALMSAAAMLDSLALQYGAENMTESNPAFALASHLMHRIPVVYSADDVYHAVNLRWRGQLQENAKHLAFGSVLPEMNHNEINGWGHPIDVLQNLCAIFLRAPEDEHPRVSKRFTVIGEILHGKSINITEVQAVGKTRLERMFSLIAMADWVSLYLAILTGTDPTPIPAIDLLKSRMG